MREVWQTPELQVAEDVGEDQVEAALALAPLVVHVLTRLLYARVLYTVYE